MTSYDLPAPDVFTAGTVGAPGQRVFYLQARDGDTLVTAPLREAAGGGAGRVLRRPARRPRAHARTASPPATCGSPSPSRRAGRSGPIGVAYDEPDDRIVVVLEELVDEEDDEDGASVRVRLTRAQVSAFVGHARALVAAGRPPCRFCGLPARPRRAHACPRMN